VLKDVVMLGGYQEAEIDFVADNPGLTLFHCHQQLHMDFGFMALFDYAKSACLHVQPDIRFAIRTDRRCRHLPPSG
jgi:hypothetical protein